MRIARFALDKYGHFSGRTLEFPLPEGMPDLHVVFGANEAGKSLFRRSLYDFFFGFEGQTFANFDCDYSDLSLTALLENEEGGRKQTLHCQRRKKNRNSLLDANGRPVEGQLDAWLGGISRSQYETEFAIDQPQMEKSGSSLIKSDERFFYAVFSAVSGIDAIFAVHQRLRDQRDGTWNNDRRFKTRYRDMQAIFNSSVRKLNELTLEPSARLQAQKSLAGAQKAIDEIDAQSEARKKDHARIALLDRGEEMLARIDRTRASLESARSGCAQQQKLLAAADRIDQLRQEQALAAVAQKEMDRLAGERNQAQARIDALAASLGWSGQDVAGQIPDRAKRRKLAELAHKVAQICSMERELGVELANAKADFAAAVQELRPWHGDMEQFADLHPPDKSDHRVHLEEMQRCRAVAADYGAKLAEAQSKLLHLQEGFKSVNKDGKAVGIGDIERARKERDGKFKQLIASENPRRHASDYLLKVKSADQLADARAANAKDAALLDRDAGRMNELREEISRHEREGSEAQAAAARQAVLWQKKMVSCGLVGLEAEHYVDWYGSYERALGHAREIRRLEKKLADSRQSPVADEYGRLCSECGLDNLDDAKAALQAVENMSEMESALQSLRQAETGSREQAQLAKCFADGAMKLAAELDVQEDAGASPEVMADRLAALLQQARKQQAAAEGLQEQLKQLLADLEGIEAGCNEQCWRDRIADFPASERRARRQEIEGQDKSYRQQLAAAVGAKKEIEQENSGYERDDEAAAHALQSRHQAEVGMAEAVADHIRAKMALSMLREALERYQRQQDGGRGLLAAAGEHLGTMTGNRYSRLEHDDEKLLLVRQDAKLGIGQLSAGTRDQLYLSLRLAGVARQARRNPLPFIADDLFASFDDRRSLAGFAVLAEIARHTQVIFLSHHEHLLAVARRALPGISEIRL